MEARLCEESFARPQHREGEIILGLSQPAPSL